VQLGRAPTGLAGPPAQTNDRGDRVDDLLEQRRVVAVGGRQGDREWGALPIDQQVELGAWLAAVDRIRAGKVPHAEPGR
jgi:hypothetical protein